MNNLPAYQKERHQLHPKAPNKVYSGKCTCGGLLWTLADKEICGSCPHPKRKFDNQK